MRDIENYEQNRQQDLLRWVALCLVAAVVLHVAGAILRVVHGPFSDFSTRTRVEFVSLEGGGLMSAVLVLAAVVALAFLTPDRIARARPIVVITLIVGTAIALLATFSIVDVLTVHIPGANSDDVITMATLNGGALTGRLSVVLPQLGALFIVLVALVAGNRLGGGDSVGSASSVLE